MVKGTNHQITTKLPPGAIEKIKTFVENNPDLELSTKELSSFELQISGSNMGRHTFLRKIVIMLARALYQPAPPEFDPRKDLH